MFNEKLFTPLVSYREATPQFSKPKSLTRQFFESPLTWVALVTLSLILVVSLVGPFLSPYPFDKTNLSLKNVGPSWQHWFGTDALGRDIFTRVCYGGRLSLTIGLTAALMDLFFGVTWGAFSGHFGGKLDILFMRICDVLYSLPHLLVVMVLTIALGTGMLPLILAIALVGWVPMARITRGEILSIKEKDYISAALALGVPTGRLLRKHFIPNALGPILVAGTMTVPRAIFLEAYLSFLGLGVQAPLASWGTMAFEGLSAMRYYPWRLFFPALVMSLTIFSFNVLADRLRSVVDARLR